jgi:hypothetical protein
MPTCHYIWYYDWKCTECCAGDRCNYYVTVSDDVDFGEEYLHASAVTLLEESVRIIEDIPVLSLYCLCFQLAGSTARNSIVVTFLSISAIKLIRDWLV